jgi:undecaprenyl-diphosphatase
MNSGWGVNSFDRTILLFLNRFAGRSLIFDAFVEVLERATLLKGAVITVPLLWIWFRDRDDKRRDREFVIWSLFISLASTFVARVLALSLPFRERPMRVGELHFHMPLTADRLTLEGWSSFPSDHAAIFFAASTCLLFASRRLGTLSLLYTFFIICLPRLYFGIHFPTDILGGALLGISINLVTTLSKVRTAVASPFLRWEQQYPSKFYPFFFVVIMEFSELFDSLRAMAHFGLRLANEIVTRVLH